MRVLGGLTLAALALSLPSCGGPGCVEEVDIRLGVYTEDPTRAHLTDAQVEVGADTVTITYVDGAEQIVVEYRVAGHSTVEL